MINTFMNDINTKVIERDLALVGSIVNKYPKLKNEIIPYITKDVSTTDKLKGQSILKSYGYDIELNKKHHPIFKINNFNVQITVFLTILLFLFPLITILISEYKKIYKKVREVYSASEKVVEGDFSIHLKEEGEGEFNILNHQFNQMANRLENSLQMLKNDKLFLKNMISDISHQLKTPLSSLIIINDILTEDEDMNKESRLNFLSKERSQLERMQWLIINLLKVARIESGSIEFRKEKVFLKEVLDIAINTLSHQLESQVICIEGNLDIAFFYGDKDWTGEALINIVKNAIEHSRGKIIITIEETPLFSSIKVEDNGIGIEEKHLPYIFERFFKVNNEVKTESIGIGLNLAKLIVESQNGTISAKSKKNHGAEITMTFLKNNTNLTKK